MLQPATFEIQGASPAAAEPCELEFLSEPAPAAAGPAFAVPTTSEDVTWITADPATGDIRPADPGSALAGFLSVPRRLGNGLGLLACGDGILVNGLPALPFTMLTTRDSLTLIPGQLYYVTERFRPYVGPPTEEMQKKKCPFCNLPFADPKSRVVTCFCGQVYHWESADSHPGTPEKKRLDCFTKVRACLSQTCRRTLTANEYLIWDPREL